jgi:peptidoglycan LD-endopeptidase LytH
MTRWQVAVAAVLLSGCNSNHAVVAPTSLPPTTVAATTTTSTTVAATTTTTISWQAQILAAPKAVVAHSFPIAAGVNTSFAKTHGEYPATDVFADCGTEVLAMATGVVVHVRKVDLYDKETDNPARRGGRSVGILGLDAVRYYTSHLDRIDVHEGQPVTAGDVIGTIGLTGDSTACHTHVGFSPPCPQAEWSVRRGVIWPWPYLGTWRKAQTSDTTSSTSTTSSSASRSSTVEASSTTEPAAEIRAWLAVHPTACVDAAADPFAADAID